MNDEDLICRHPPERGDSGRRAVVVYSCCCCCCCCLHTVGGMVGALLGGGLGADPENRFDPERKIPLVHWLFGRLPWTQWIFWSSFAITVALSLLVAPAWIALGVGISLPTALMQAPLYVAGAVLMAGPLYLLLAGVISAVRLKLTREPPVTRVHWWGLGKAMLGALAGSILGTVLMVLIFFVMR